MLVVCVAVVVELESSLSVLGCGDPGALLSLVVCASEDIELLSCCWA